MTPQKQKQQQQHRRPQQDEANDDDDCDESKCVSTGMSGDFNSSFTCFTDGRYDPMMCADGYKPRIVEKEPTVLDNLLSMDDDRYDQFDVSYQYFTCCPPRLSAKTNISRRCSNPTTNFYGSIVANTNNNKSNSTSMICNDDTRPYPHQMKMNKHANSGELIPSYMCCDSAENKTADFRDETECVPYHNEFYERQISARNEIGYITTMMCDFPDGAYQFPRHLPTNSSSFTYFECCKTGPGQLFLQDAAFKRTVYPQIAISSIAVIFCIILIISLSIPLLIQLKKQRKQTKQRTSRQSRGADESDYSTYNLYLVYLAIPDLILNLYLLGMYGSYANQKFNTGFHGSIIREDISAIIDSFEGAFVVACSTANLFLNAVVSYEVLILLRNSNQVRRSNPPSLRKVTLQAVVVYSFSMLVFVIHYCISSAAAKADKKGDYERSGSLWSANLYWSFVVTYALPIGFFGCVSIIIWCRGYIPSATGRMKELAWYFFRVIVVFCLFWIPGMYFLLVGAADKDYGGKHVTIGLLFCALQPIVSTCMAMTKSDVRKYIFDLISISYCFDRKSEAQRRETQNTVNTDV